MNEFRIQAHTSELREMYAHIVAKRRTEFANVSERATGLLHKSHSHCQSQSITNKRGNFQAEHSHHLRAQS